MATDKMTKMLCARKAEIVLSVNKLCVSHPVPQQSESITDPGLKSTLTLSFFFNEGSQLPCHPSTLLQGCTSAPLFTAWTKPTLFFLKCLVHKHKQQSRLSLTVVNSNISAGNRGAISKPTLSLHLSPAATPA